MSFFQMIFVHVLRYQSGWIVTLLHTPENPSVYSLSTLDPSNWQSTILSWQATESLLVSNNYSGIMASVNRSRSSYIFSNMTSAIQPLLNGNIYYAVVGNSLVNTHVASNYCYLNTSQPELVDYYAAVAYSYNADPSLLYSINQAAQSVQSNAVYLYNSYFLNNCTTYNNAMPLLVTNLLGLFIIVGAGLLVSLVIMILEILYKEFQLFMERRTLASGTHYVFNRFYCARVLKACMSSLQLIGRVLAFRKPLS